MSSILFSDRIYSTKEVCEIFGISYNTLARRVAKGLFPPPVRFLRGKYDGRDLQRMVTENKNWYELTNEKLNTEVHIYAKQLQEERKREPEVFFAS